MELLKTSKELSNTLYAAINYSLHFLFYWDQTLSDSCVRLSWAELPNPISSLKKEVSSRQMRRLTKLISVHPLFEKNGMNAWEKTV